VLVGLPIVLSSVALLAWSQSRPAEKCEVVEEIAARA
jgi:hypothetical protein